MYIITIKVYVARRIHDLQTLLCAYNGTSEAAANMLTHTHACVCIYRYVYLNQKMNSIA